MRGVSGSVGSLVGLGKGGGYLQGGWWVQWGWGHVGGIRELVVSQEELGRSTEGFVCPEVQGIWWVCWG